MVAEGPISEGAAPDSTVKLNITVGKKDLVVPLTPRDDHIYRLSNLDQNVAIIVKTVYLFQAQDDKRDSDPAVVLKEALEKVLDYWYPCAGRLALSPDFKLQINYNSDGVVFVEASADAALADLGDISRPHERLHQLIYEFPGASNILEIPPVIVQVTKFKCGGFAVGLAMQHALFDGIGANEFVKAWGETARGLALSQVPHLDRSVLAARSPPKVSFPHDEFATIESLSEDDRLDLSGEIVHKSFLFTQEDIEKLKKTVTAESEIKRCSTFEVLSGLIWRARTLALDMHPDQKTRLYFAVDGRQKFIPPIPAGYMGNGIVLTFSMTTSQDLISNPLSHSVKLVQEAIHLIDDEYMRSCIDCFEMTRARPASTASVCITTWSRLPFHSTDFGWGEPVQCGPVTVPDKEVVLFTAQGTDRKSMNVLLGLPPAAMERFEKALQDE